MAELTINRTLAGAYKAHLESLGLGVAVYRDGSHRNADGDLAVPLPIIVVQEAIGEVPELHGDTDQPGAHLGTDELVQIDLLQHARSQPDASGRTTVVENYELRDRVAAALRTRGSLAQRAPWRIYGVRVETGQRWPVVDNIVRHTWTVHVRRDTERRA